MPYINKDLHKSLYWRMLDAAALDFNYYFATNKNIPEDVINQVKNDSDTFIITCDECEITNEIYDFVCSLDIPQDKILLMSDDPDHAFSKYFSCLGETVIRWHSDPLIGLETLEKKKYDKCFINFNKRWRLHRPALVGLLKAKNLLDHGLVSLGNADIYPCDWNIVFDQVLNLLSNNKNLYSLFKNYESEICNLPYMYIDFTNLSLNPSTPYVRIRETANETSELYKNTYFSVVTETYFFENTGRFLSEKVFKPIAFKHPFILLGRPKSLELLKSMGYKTFHPYIDESYDNEVNDANRLELILNEIERLCKLSQDELYQFIDGVKNITEHNFLNLRSKTSHIISRG